MKRYAVVVDYVTTVNVLVDARDEYSAANKVARYINTRKGAHRAIENMIDNWEGGLEIACVFEEGYEADWDDKGYMEI